MLRLNLTSEAEWLDLGPGLRLRVLPLTTAVMMAARKDAQAQMALPEPVDAQQTDLDTDSIGLAMAKAVARIVVTEWEGVGDADGTPVRVAGSAVIGWVMNAALQLGAALGIAPRAIAELLPPVEAVMVRKINEEMRSSGSNQ